MGRVAVRATVLALLLALVGGGATALAMDKTITLTVDGQDRTVHTFAGDVAAALQAAGIAAAPQDRVEPALPTSIDNGDHVIFSRARRLILDEGPSQREVWTTAPTVGQALAGLGVQAQPIQMSISPSTAIPLAGLALELRVPHKVTLTDGTGAKTAVTTTAGTVAGLLEEHRIVLGVDDVSLPSGDAPLTDGMDVQVVRNGVGEVVETRAAPPPVQKVDDPSLPRGKEVVVNPGKPGVSSAIMKIYVQNGQEVRRQQIGAGAMTAAVPRVIRIGTNEDAPAAPAVDDGSIWDHIAQVRGHRQLGHQHRQRLLRRPAVRRGHVAGVRRRDLRAAAQPGQPRGADLDRGEGARLPRRRLRRMARLFAQARPAPVTGAPTAGCTLPT